MKKILILAALIAAFANCKEKEKEQTAEMTEEKETMENSCRMEGNLALFSAKRPLQTTTERRDLSFFKQRD